MPRSVWLLGCLLLLLPWSSVRASDVDTLQARLKADYLTGSSGSAASYLSSQQTDGRWTDINYADTSAVSWPPVTHLNRLRQMAVSYNKSVNAAMLTGVTNGLAYWYTRKPRSSNWWWNDIGQQQQLGPILVMMKPYLSAAQITTGAGYLNDPSDTGQNLVWLATETVQRGCLLDSLTVVNRGLNAIKNEVTITTGEGIQPDFSFYQHGNQLYNGGYGQGFVSDVSYWAYMVRGLSFAFASDKLDVFSALILDGTQWMLRRGYKDFACTGREISRANNGSSSGFVAPLNRMIGLNTPRTSEFQAMVSHLNGQNDSALAGDKHFWRTDYHVARRAGYHVSVKMCSTRTTGTEKINNENLKGYYLPFGATTILTGGNEYYNIFPVWDWARIPGVTAPHKATPPNIATYVKGTTSFVGGASNGKYGAAALDLACDGVTGKKGWFFFDEGFVALGAGITCSGANPVYTSLNQCYLSGNVTVSYDTGAGSVAAPGQQILDSPKWIWHNNVGYVLPGTGPVVLKSQAQSGTWQAINASGSATMITKDVFSLWFDHGVNPSAKSYQYIVMPGAALSAVRTLANACPLRIISNTASIQAVRHDGAEIAGIVFYQAGQVDIRSGVTLKTDQPCIMLVDESGESTCVTVANPQNAALTVNVDVFAQRLVFTLPGGMDAGKSVTVNVPIEPVNVALTAPTTGAIYTAPASITLAADVWSSSGTIARVEFFNGATLLDEDTTSPYAYTWSNVTEGAYTLTARATDNVGAMTTSAVVNVTVMSAGASVSATGGITTNFSYLGTNFTAHIFTNSGTFVVTSGGFVDYLIVGAGGAGGGGNGINSGGGGGGGGGVLSGRAIFGAGAYTITVATTAVARVPTAASTSGTDGGDSIVTNTATGFGLTAKGGGGGGGGAQAGHAGGSGGGGGDSSSAQGGGAGTVGQGFSGGTNTGKNAGAGGGGAGGKGANTAATGVPTSGGNGVTNWILGEANTYAGGGGGGCRQTAWAAGGLGGGGRGGTNRTTVDGMDGLPGTGGGGGGKSTMATASSLTAGNGGSGIVIIRYVTGGDPDTDGDGLLDSVDPDDDNDGMSDVDEATAGTNSKNAGSVLAMSGPGVTVFQPNELVVRWWSASNKLYTLQAATNLLAGFTLILGSNILATPPENVHTDSVGSAGSRYYRVKVE